MECARPRLHLEVMVKAGRFEIPVDAKHAVVPLREQDGDVRERERPARAAFVRVEGDERRHQVFP